MGDVVSIHRNNPRPKDCDRALALMQEAQRLLEGLVERYEVPSGSPPEATLDYLGQAIGMLAPEEDEPSLG